MNGRQRCNKCPVFIYQLYRQLFKFVITMEGVSGLQPPIFLDVLIKLFASYINLDSIDGKSLIIIGFPS